MEPGDFTVGIEEEYQLVDPETGALRGRGPELVAADRTGAAKEEFQRTAVEVNTPVCRDSTEVLDRITTLRRRMAALATAQGLAIVSAGLHPVGAYPASQIAADPRYWRIAARGGIVARELHIFGLHVHVAVPDREAAVRAMCGVAPYSPLLLALTASSPFHQGRDTAFSSFRTMLRDMFPRVGPPLPVASAAEYDRLLEVLREDDETGSSLAWDVRPSAKYPTLEFRYFDATPWVELAAAIAASARALTVMFHDRPPPQPSGLELQLLKENRWRAARYGLDARFYRLGSATGSQWDARTAIRALLERIRPIQERLGDGGSAEVIERVLATGTAADRARTVFRREGSFPAVTRWLAEQTLHGLGRTRDSDAA